MNPSQSSYVSLKKFSRSAFLILLTLGASLIIGLLSFGGLYVLWPNLILASISFILSVAYEGEIYFQNLKSALNKLFKPDYASFELACNFLKDHFPLHLPKEMRPKFFNDYEAELYALHRAIDLKQHQEIRKSKLKLKKMEQLFTEILKGHKKLKDMTQDEDRLYRYLVLLNLPKKYQETLKTRQWYYRSIQIFSGLTTIFMGFGTTYLLMETFAVIPFLAAISLSLWPVLIVPMAIIAGIAYGLLTYNTMTNMLANNSIRMRFQKLYNDFKTQGLTWRNALSATITLTLSGLAIGLTICTAGTWWTIVKNTPPLFRWMKQIPQFIMGVIAPLITSIAALAFNLENSSESMEIIDEALQTDLKKQWHDFKQRFKRAFEKENRAQLLNPFRLILAVTFIPIRIALFFAHLVSIGVTGDRMPGVSYIVSALLGIVSEFFEDMHYFVHNHKHDLRSLIDARLSGTDHHNHDNDLPTQILKFIALPIKIFSSLWNYGFSQFNALENRLTFKDSFKNLMNYDLVPAAAPTPVTKIDSSKKEQKPSTDLTKELPSDVTGCNCCTPPEAIPLKTVYFEKEKPVITIPVRSSRTSNQPMKTTKPEPTKLEPTKTKQTQPIEPTKPIASNQACACCPPQEIKLTPVHFFNSSETCFFIKPKKRKTKKANQEPEPTEEKLIKI